MAKERHRIYTDKQIRQMTEKASIRAFLHAVTMTMAYLMEDPEIDFSEERLVDLFNSVLKWEQNRTKEHDITIGTIKKIIKDNTGLIIDYD